MTRPVALVHRLGSVVVVDDDHACSAERKGWRCSLEPQHLGNHEAWATDPLELCLVWPRRTVANRTKTKPDPRQMSLGEK